MPRRYNRNRINAIRERGRMMARARWDQERERRDLEAPAIARYLAEIQAENLPKESGDILGCLQWTDAATGKTRRWIVRIGKRRDQITLEAPGGKATRSHGWTWALNHLRGFLAGTKHT